MIGHVNLLDKVYYLKNHQVYEVIIVSKIYKNTEPYGFHDSFKAVNVILNDNVESLNINYLYYTDDEAYRQLLSNIEKEISSEEEFIQRAQLLLTDLINTRNNILDKLDNISN